MLECMILMYIYIFDLPITSDFVIAYVCFCELQ